MAFSAPTLIGSASKTASSTTLTITNSVAVPEAAYIDVCVAYDNSQGPPSSIKWGDRDLTELAPTRQANVGTGVTQAQWRLRYVQYPGTRDFVITFSAAVGTVVAQAHYVRGGSVLDQSNKKETDNTTAPATGLAKTTTVADTVHIANFAAVGPTTDAAATAGVGHTLLTRNGTSGGTPDITLQTTYEILTATGNMRATLSVSTARDFTASIIALRKRQTFTVKKCVQHHRNRNHLPDEVFFLLEDEAGRQEEFTMDPDVFDSKTFDERKEYVRKIAAIWAANLLDGELVWDESTTRDTAMAALVNETVDV